MNKLKREDYPIKNLTSGETLYLKTFTISGSEAGPHVHIQSGVHGAELQGHGVIYHLMEYFKNAKLNGSITFIPMANPMALNQKSGTHTLGRFNPVTGNNWNRNYVDLVNVDEEKSKLNLGQFCKNNLTSSWDEVKILFKKELQDSFKAYRQYLSKWGLSDNIKLNLVLQELAAKADIVIDLHTGPVACRYLYSAEYEKESAKHFLFPHTLIIPNEFAGAMDEACFSPWIALKNKFLQFKKEIPMDFESYTVELGSEEELSLKDGIIDCHRVLNYLKHKNIAPDFKEALTITKQYYSYLKDYKTYYSPCGGIIDYAGCPGEIVKKGETLGRLLRFNSLHSWEDFHQCLLSIKANNDCLVINRCPSSSVSEGVQIFQVMENFKTF